MSSVARDIRSLAALPHGWRRALTAISMLWVATAVGAGMAFLTQALLARELGPSDYGLFTSSLATVSMIAPLAGFGLSQFWLKSYGAEGWGGDRWLRPSLRFIAATTALTLVSLALWAWIGAPADARLTLLLLLPVVIGVLTAALIGSKLRLEERHGALALWQLMTPGSRLLVAILLLLIPTLAGKFVAAGYGVISIAVAFLAWPQVREMLNGRMRLHGHGPRPTATSASGSEPRVIDVWSQAWAYGLAAVLYPIMFQISTVMLKYLDGNTQAGMFGIALAVMSAIYLIPATLYQKFLLSKLHRWAVHDVHKFWLVYRNGNIAMLASGVVLGALMALCAPWMVPIAFGEKYRPVIHLLQLLAVCVPIRFLSTGVGSALLSERHMRYRVVSMAAAGALVVLLNVWLIPAHREMGAAYATVAGELVLLLGLYGGVRLFRADLDGRAH